MREAGVDDLSQPLEPTATPEEPTAVPVEPTATPEEPTAVPVEPTATPEEPTATVEPTATPEEPTAVPVEPTATPKEPTAVPVEPTATPEEPTAVPVEPTATPEEPTAVPVDPTATPEEPTAVPVEPTAGAMEPARPLSLRAMAAALAVLMAVLVFHPGFLNLLVRSEDADITLTQVQNFYYWNRYHQGAPQELTVDSKISLTTTYFYPRRTYIIIHGFLSSGMDGWIITLKDALLGREDCNVISVNWAAGSITAEYYIVNGRVPEVGEEVSKLLLFLQKATGLTPDLVHIIGHSLGAHVAGYTGKKLNGTVARITGLDPAGHRYHQAEPTDRLHKTDAAFVDVIHTHGCTTILSQWTDCYGIDENLGDADFWPNGGERQPACKEGGDGEASVKDGSSCDHGMAYVFYIESLAYTASTTRFLARPCISWKLYNNGSCPCSSPAQYMGYNVNPNVPGVFYLNTNNTAPYALLDPDCSAGAFSALEIVGIVMLTILAVLMIVLSLQQFFGVPAVLTRVRVALWLDSSSWTGLKESQSSQLLSAGDNQVNT